METHLRERTSISLEIGTKKKSEIQALKKALKTGEIEASGPAWNSGVDRWEIRVKLPFADAKEHERMKKQVLKILKDAGCAFAQGPKQNRKA